jgi:hypothetical protein
MTVAEDYLIFQLMKEWKRELSKIRKKESKRKISYELRTILNELFEDFDSIARALVYSGERLERRKEKKNLIDQNGLLTRSGTIELENEMFRYIAKSQRWASYMGYIGSIIYLIIFFTVSALVKTEVINIPLGAFIANLIFTASIPPGLYYAWKANSRRNDFQIANNRAHVGMKLNLLIEKFKNFPKRYEDFDGTDKEYELLEIMGSKELRRHNKGNKCSKGFNKLKGYTMFLQRSSTELMTEFSDFYFINYKVDELEIIEIEMV